MQLSLIDRDVIGQVAPARARGVGKPAKSLVVALQVIQFLAECISQKHSGPILDSWTRKLRLQLLDVIGVRTLHTQLRSQQLAGVLRRIERDGAVAGRLRFSQPAETALARREVVPKPRRIRSQLDDAPVQRIRTIVPAQEERGVSQAVIRIGDARSALEGQQNHLFRFARAPELQQYPREHAMGWNAHTLARHGTLGEFQCLGEASGLHQSVRLDIGPWCSCHIRADLKAIPPLVNHVCDTHLAKPDSLTRPAPLPAIARLGMSDCCVNVSSS